jgi:hypothetical protein
MALQNTSAGVTSALLMLNRARLGVPGGQWPSRLAAPA